MGELSDFYKTLSDDMRSSCYSATKEVIDKRSNTFGHELRINMSICQRQYKNFTNVHTNTKMEIYEKIELHSGADLVRYGYKRLNNKMGYKEVPWKTKTGNGHQVPFDLIANVTSTGRQAIFRSGTKKGTAKPGNYHGTGFIPQVIHEQLNGIDEEILNLFETKMAMKD